MSVDLAAGERLNIKRLGEKKMKTWKLVSGILSIVICLFVLFQSCAAGLSNTMQGNGELGGTAGLIVAIMLLAGGIVSIATRKSSGKGGNIALIVLLESARCLVSHWPGVILIW